MRRKGTLMGDGERERHGIQTLGIILPFHSGRKQMPIFPAIDFLFGLCIHFSTSPTILRDMRRSRNRLKMNRTIPDHKASAGRDQSLRSPTTNYSPACWMRSLIRFRRQLIRVIDSGAHKVLLIKNIYGHVWW
jgi:hypothetical protein